MRDETMSQDLVLSIFGGFLESYRMHIRLEEDNLFPEALRFLSDGDWEEVAWNLVQQANRCTIRPSNASRPCGTACSGYFPTPARRNFLL